MTSEVITRPAQDTSSRFTPPSIYTPPPSSPHKLLLDALKQTRYGTLTLVTPEGKKLIFSGDDAGPSAHMQVNSWRGLDETVLRGQFGFADSYLHGRLDSSNMPALLTFFLLNLPAIERYFYGLPWHMLWMKLRYGLQGNSQRGSRRNVASHYDLGNDFYKLWLDEGMTYSCALFGGDATRSLEEAQQAKYQRILRKLDAKPGQHIFEIGCGWGGFAETAALEDVRVTAITLSEQQADYARQRLKRTGVHHLAMVELADYREISGQYDHIVSIGMFEHVGEKYWPDYFATIRKCLKPGGKAMIQSITLDEQVFKDTYGKPGFMETYIFPGGMLPSPSRFRDEVESAGLACREMFAFGQDYKRTLEHWLARFEAKIDQVRALGRDEFFIRLWRFYLAGCIAAFTTGRTNVMQAELAHATSNGASARNVVSFPRGG